METDPAELTAPQGTQWVRPVGVHGRAPRSRVGFLAIALLVAVIACGPAATEATTQPEPTPAILAPADGPGTAPTSSTAREATPAPPTPTPAAPSPTPVPPPAPATPPQRPGPTPTPPPLPQLPTGIEPARIVIPAIGVDAKVIDLDLRGPEPEVPENFAETGWYEQTRLPGEIGPSVIAGHIDSRTGPAVFHRLDQLEPGDEIIVSDGTGVMRVFEVTASGQYGKDALPDEVFGFGDPVAELRLITCGGTFDAAAGHYRDNYVVYARAVA